MGCLQKERSIDLSPLLTSFYPTLSQPVSLTLSPPALPETNHSSSLRSPIKSNDPHLVSNGHRCLFVTLCLHHFMDYQQSAASLITSYHNLSICHAVVGPGVSPWTGPLLTAVDDHFALSLARWCLASVCIDTFFKKMLRTSPTVLSERRNYAKSLALRCDWKMYIYSDCLHGQINTFPLWWAFTCPALTPFL